MSVDTRAPLNGSCELLAILNRAPIEEFTHQGFFALFQGPRFNSPKERLISLISQAYIVLLCELRKKAEMKCRLKTQLEFSAGWSELQPMKLRELFWRNSLIAVGQWSPFGQPARMTQGSASCSISRKERPSSECENWNLRQTPMQHGQSLYPSQSTPICKSMIHSER